MPGPLFIGFALAVVLVIVAHEANYRTRTNAQRLNVASHAGPAAGEGATALQKHPTKAAPGCFQLTHIPPTQNWPAAATPQEICGRAACALEIAQQRARSEWWYVAWAMKQARGNRA